MNVKKKVDLVMTIFSMLLVMAKANANAMGMRLGYYEHSCPDAETIVHQITQRFIKSDPSLAAGLLRLNFHDCFVRGCDGSILLKPTPTNTQTELTAIPNLTLRGFEIIDAVKEELEKRCPRVVSCADILALAARDSIQTINGPWWEVATGRKDGRVSLASEALADIPSPFSDINTLRMNFAAKGLNTKDLVVLSGAHTIGNAHCFIILNRLYNFTGRGDTDPTLSPDYAAFLKTKCRPVAGDTTTVVPMDQFTPMVFDEKYYTMVDQNRGLFQSDAALLNDPITRLYTKFQVISRGWTFHRDFADSMVKLINVGVLTGTQGEVRKNCGFVN